MPSCLGWMSLGEFFVPALSTHCCALAPMPTLSSSLVLLHLGQAVQLPDPAENHSICPSHHSSSIFWFCTSLQPARPCKCRAVPEPAPNRPQQLLLVCVPVIDTRNVPVPKVQWAAPLGSIDNPLQAGFFPSPGQPCCKCHQTIACTATMPSHPLRNGLKTLPFAGVPLFFF